MVADSTVTKARAEAYLAVQSLATMINSGEEDMGRLERAEWVASLAIAQFREALDDVRRREPVQGR